MLCIYRKSVKMKIIQKISEQIKDFLRSLNLEVLIHNFL